MYREIMIKWIIIPIIIVFVLFVGWFLYKITRIADEFYQWARIVDNKIDRIETISDYYDVLKDYHKLIYLDVLGKGHADIIRLRGRLEEVFKQLNYKKHGKN